MIPACELEAIEMVVIRLKEEYERQGKGPNSRSRIMPNAFERGDIGNTSYIRYNNNISNNITTTTTSSTSTSTYRGNNIQAREGSSSNTSNHI